MVRKYLKPSTAGTKKRSQVSISASSKGFVHILCWELKDRWFCLDKWQIWQGSYVLLCFSLGKSNTSKRESILVMERWPNILCHAIKLTCKLEHIGVIPGNDWLSCKLSKFKHTSLQLYYLDQSSFLLQKSE